MGQGRGLEVLDGVGEGIQERIYYLNIQQYLFGIIFFVIFLHFYRDYSISEIIIVAVCHVLTK